MNFAPGKIPLRDKSPRKCVYNVPAQETAKYRAKFGWLLLSDVAALTKPRAKTRNLLKSAGVPQTNEPISAASQPKFTILSGHVGRYCFLTFFPIVDMCLTCEDIPRESCAMVRRWRLFDDLFRPIFSARHVQQVSDLHLKFALRPHHVWKYGRYPICDG